MGEVEEMIFNQAAEWILFKNSFNIIKSTPNSTSQVKLVPRPIFSFMLVTFSRSWRV